MSCLPRIKYTLFGGTLETGSKIVGVSHILVYSLCFFVVYLYYSLPDTGDWDWESEFDGNSTSSASNATVLSNSTEFTMLNLDIQSTFFLEESTFAQVVYGAFLLYGINLKKPDIIFSWVLLQIALIFHSQLLILMNIILALHVSPSHVILYIFEELIIILLELYCMTIVYNYSLDLRSHTSLTASNRYF